LNYLQYGEESKLIGIFQGKKMEYNKLILKSLVTGPKTTKQIAEYIYYNRRQKPKLRLHPKKAKEPNENEVKKIVSIISRKGSRLEELVTKEYIFRENNLWDLNIKGFCVALTEVNSIIEFYPSINQIETLNEIQRKLYKQPLIKQILKNDIPKEDADRMLDFFKSPKYFQFLKDSTNELLKQGLDLDKVNDFFSLFLAKHITFLVKYVSEEVLIHE